jgi:hypothetical protein
MCRLGNTLWRSGQGMCCCARCSSSASASLPAPSATASPYTWSGLRAVLMLCYNQHVNMPLFSPMDEHAVRGWCTPRWGRFYPLMPRCNACDVMFCMEK